MWPQKPGRQQPAAVKLSSPSRAEVVNFTAEVKVQCVVWSGSHEQLRPSFITH